MSEVGNKRIIFKADADAAIVVASHFFQVVACASVSWLHWMQSKGHKVKGKPCVYASTQAKAVSEF